jgi:hypothetical protein
MKISMTFPVYFMLPGTGHILALGESSFIHAL